MKYSKIFKISHSIISKENIKFEKILINKF